LKQKLKLFEKDACPSKIQDGHHLLIMNYLNCSNGDASIRLGRHTLQGTLFGKKVCATQIKMVTVLN